jgi:WD40 repeat protein
VVVSPEGKLAATCGADGRVRIWDIATGQDVRPQTGHDDALSGVVALPDGETLVTASLDGSLRWWEAKTGKQKRRIDGPGGGVTSLALSADGKLLVAGGLAGNVGIWDAASGGKKHIGKGPGGPVRRLVLSADGTLIAGAIPVEKATLVELWDAAMLREVKRLEELEENVQALAFSPDGKELAAVSMDEPVHRWEVATGKGLPLKEGLRGVTALVYSPEGRYLAAGFGGSRSVVLWDVKTGARITEFDAEGSAIAALAFSPDGATIATAHADGKARLWEVRTGKERGKFEGHIGSLTGVCFSADGRLLATTANDQTALVWNRLGTETTFPKTGDALSGLWRDLASDDAGRAYGAICTLIQAPEESVAFLQPRLEPLPKVDATQVTRWIASLDARAFKAREEAMENLTRLGRLVEQPLKESLNGKLSLEAKRRVEELLKRMSGEGPVEEWKRLGRAVEVLELIGTEKALEIIKKIADGGDFGPTHEARAAVARMQRRK